MENYEQKYKEALKIMESLHSVVKYQSSSDALLTSQTIEKAFPELRESEDEKIRKAQLNYWRSVGGKEWYGVPVQEVIAWLEKQGEQMSDPRYSILDKLIDADDIYQMSVNDAMVEEAKNKAIEALSKLEISKLLGLKKQGK